MAQTLGAHLDCSDWSIPEWEKGVRRRIGWSLFMQDKWGALIYGRPSHINTDNWEVKPLDAYDFPETTQDDDDEEGSSEVEAGKQLFLAMISLTGILADILDQLFSLRIIRKHLTTAEILEKVKPLQIRLKQWYSELPSSLSMGETKTRRLSSNGCLHLAYYATEIALHRAILRSYTVPEIDRDIRLITRSAAKARFTAAVEFVKQLRPEHLQSFWYFASKINLAIIGTFGFILWNTSNDEQEREYYTSQSAEYRWVLRMGSNAADFMKYTVSLLDMSNILKQRIKSHLSTLSPIANTSENIDGYGISRPLGDYTSPNSQLDWLHNLNQQFDISLEDLAGYSVHGFESFQ